MLAEMELDVARVLPSHRNPRLPLSDFNDKPSLLRSKSVLAQLAEHGLYLNFEVRKAKSSKFTEEFYRYIQPLCSTCGAPLDTFQKKEDSPETTPQLELSVVLSPQFVDDTPRLRRQLECWWFNSALA